MRWQKAPMIAGGILIFLLFLLMLISVNRLFPFCRLLTLSSTVVGCLGWLAAAAALGLAAWDFPGRVALLFLLFFTFAWWRGPYLEPPADPIEHLNRIYDCCGQDSDRIRRAERGSTQRNSIGLWHYSMAAVLLCNQGESGADPTGILHRIDLAHALFVGLVGVALLLTAKAAGLPDQWAFLSCVIAFFFMGTNRFAYFSYYSLAPTFTSILLYWLWIARFFFRSGKRETILGLSVASLMLPVIWVNHRQEAGFLGLVILAWLAVNIYFHGMSRQSGLKAWRFLLFFFSTLFFLFFVLPQLPLVREILGDFFIRDLWEKNRHLVVNWKGIFLWGRIGGYRVDETFYGMGIFLAGLSFLYFAVNRGDTERKVRIWLLSFLPFFGYLLPLLNFIWLSNVQYYEYYRLCYASLFWLLIADCLRLAGDRILRHGRSFFRSRGGGHEG